MKGVYLKNHREREMREREGGGRQTCLNDDGSK